MTAVEPPTGRAFFCADYSRVAEEQLFGTAKQVDLWILIEYRGRWERNAEAVLPAGLQASLSAVESAGRQVRIGLLKQTRRQNQPLLCFVAVSGEDNPRQYCFEFGDLDELAAIDWARPEPAGGKEVAAPLFAFCTHGTHDLCCARYGNAVYQASQSDLVWQVSHVGGCRFAPNLVCLPHGVVYGRLDEAEARLAIEAHESGRIYPPRYRGRSCYPKAVQAADYYLRTETNLLDLDEFKLLRYERSDEASWRIEWRSKTYSRSYSLTVAAEPASVPTYKSCAAAHPSPRERFRLAGFESY